MTERLTGGCFCGSVRYEVAGPLAPATRCHCSMCRKRFGGTGSVMAPARDFVWLEGEELVTRYGSSWALGFCRVCGSTLVGIHEGTVMGITVSGLDGDPEVTVDRHIFVGSRASWDVVPEDAPHFEEWPPSE